MSIDEGVSASSSGTKQKSLTNPHAIVMVGGTPALSLLQQFYLWLCNQPHIILLSALLSELLSDSARVIVTQ